MAEFRQREKKYLIQKAKVPYKDLPGFEITITKWEFDTIIGTCHTLNNINNNK